jgi:hypothetical protein
MTQRTSVWIVEINGGTANSPRNWFPLIIDVWARKKDAVQSAKRFKHGRVRRYDRVADRSRKEKHR